MSGHLQSCSKFQELLKSAVEMTKNEVTREIIEKRERQKGTLSTLLNVNLCILLVIFRGTDENILLFALFIGYLSVTCVRERKMQLESS